MKKLALILLLLTTLCVHTQQKEPSPSLFQKIAAPIKKVLYGNKEKKPAVRTQEKTHVGVLGITGEITSCTEFVKNLYEMKKNPNIKALLLHIDSGGGWALVSAEIMATELKNFKKEKPVIVLIENNCLSSAYLIASAATTIFAGQLSWIGCIGTIFEISYDKKIKFTFITSGKFKRPVFDENYNINDEYKQYIQKNTDKLSEIMCTLVAQNRNLTVESIKNQEARSYTSQDALELGLIDSIGSLSDVFAKTAELVKLNGNEVRGPLVFVDAEGKEVFRV